MNRRHLQIFQNRFYLFLTNILLLGVRITEHLDDGKCLEVVWRVSGGCLRGV